MLSPKFSAGDAAIAQKFPRFAFCSATIATKFARSIAVVVVAGHYPLT
jgi:hypothetical protein